jgi:DNA-directed RNA polymerase subunit beta
VALDVNVVSEEGERAEMRDEDDDLLRAAEELGIDLSGVRATDGAAADESTDTEDDTEAVAVEQDDDDATAEPDLESTEELAEEDFATDKDPYIEDDAEVEAEAETDVEAN